MHAAVSGRGTIRLEVDANPLLIWLVVIVET
jgi:hypothetical protein